MACHHFDYSHRLYSNKRFMTTNSRMVVMGKDKIIKLINRLTDSGIVFHSEIIANHAEEHNDFKAAIMSDVSEQINDKSPYALAIVCGDSSTHLAVIKRKMEFPGGGIAVASYGLHTTLHYSLDELKLDEVVAGEEATLIPAYDLKWALKKLYDHEFDEDGVKEIVTKYVNLSSPTFESEGNELFSDDAENMSVKMFAVKKDPIMKPIFGINEDDMIYKDLYSAGNGELISDAAGHARYLTRDGRCLDVINVNRKAGEKALGVDLIYYIREFRSIVMLQYKRISYPAKTYYTNSDGNYLKEIERMTETRHRFAMPDKVEDKIKHKYFRLSNCPYYFKICPESSSTLNKYVAGACIHLDHWQALMKSEHCQTKQGNQKLGYDELDGRYLKSSEFIELTKRGMLGGYISGLEALSDIILELKNLNHTVVASIESPGEGYTDT